MLFIYFCLQQKVCVVIVGWWWECVVAVDGMRVLTLLTWSHVFYLHAHICTYDAFLVTFTVVSFLLTADVDESFTKKNFFCWFLEKSVSNLFLIFRKCFFFVFFLNYSHEELNSPSLGFRTSINFKRCSFYVFQKHKLFIFLLTVYQCCYFYLFCVFYVFFVICCSLYPETNCLVQNTNFHVFFAAHQLHFWNNTSAQVLLLRL